MLPALSRTGSLKRRRLADPSSKYRRFDGSAATPSPVQQASSSRSPTPLGSAHSYLQGSLSRSGKLRAGPLGSKLTKKPTAKPGSILTPVTTGARNSSGSTHQLQLHHSHGNGAFSVLSSMGGSTWSVASDAAPLQVKPSASTGSLAAGLQGQPLQSNNQSNNDSANSRADADAAAAAGSCRRVSATDGHTTKPASGSSTGRHSFSAAVSPMRNTALASPKRKKKRAPPLTLSWTARSKAAAAAQAPLGGPHTPTGPANSILLSPVPTAAPLQGSLRTLATAAASAAPTAEPSTPLAAKLDPAQRPAANALTPLHMASAAMPVAHEPANPWDAIDKQRPQSRLSPIKGGAPAVEADGASFQPIPAAPGAGTAALPPLEAPMASEADSGMATTNSSDGVGFRPRRRSVSGVLTRSQELQGALGGESAAAAGGDGSGGGGSKDSTVVECQVLVETNVHKKDAVGGRVGPLKRRLKASVTEVLAALGMDSVSTSCRVRCACEYCPGVHFGGTDAPAAFVEVASSAAVLLLPRLHYHLQQGIAEALEAHLQVPMDRYYCNLVDLPSPATENAAEVPGVAQSPEAKSPLAIGSATTLAPGGGALSGAGIRARDRRRVLPSVPSNLSMLTADIWPKTPMSASVCSSVDDADSRSGSPASLNDRGSSSTRSVLRGRSSLKRNAGSFHSMSSLQRSKHRAPAANGAMLRLGVNGNTRGSTPMPGLSHAGASRRVRGRRAAPAARRLQQIKHPQLPTVAQSPPQQQVGIGGSGAVNGLALLSPVRGSSGGVGGLQSTFGSFSGLGSLKELGSSMGSLGRE